jgi:hypothetical protein
MPINQKLLSTIFILCLCFFNWLTIDSLYLYIIFFIFLFGGLFIDKILLINIRTYKFISFVNSYVFIGVLYFIILFPYSIIFKLFNKNNNKSTDLNSAYKNRNIEYDWSNIENPW